MPLMRPINGEMQAVPRNATHYRVTQYDDLIFYRSCSCGCGQLEFWNNQRWDTPENYRRRGLKLTRLVFNAQGYTADDS
jgi:hypothetical protein